MTGTTLQNIKKWSFDDRHHKKKIIEALTASFCKTKITEALLAGNLNKTKWTEAFNAGVPLKINFKAFDCRHIFTKQKELKLSLQASLYKTGRNEALTAGTLYKHDELNLYHHFAKQKKTESLKTATPFQNKNWSFDCKCSFIRQELKLWRYPFEKQE